MHAATAARHPAAVHIRERLHDAGQRPAGAVPVEDRPVQRPAVERALRARRAHLRPNSCEALSTEADGTQWTSSALGRVLDQSELQSNFFTVSPTNGAIAEAELQSGQLTTGKNALTTIAVGLGTAHDVAFGCDNSLAAQSPAVLRVAIYDTGPGWHVTQNVVIDGTKGLHVMAFPNPAKTGVISVIRTDAGTFPVGYVVY